MSSDTIKISVRIPSELLTKIDQLEGKNRNEKLVKCIRTGYEWLKR